MVRVNWLGLPVCSRMVWLDSSNSLDKRCRRGAEAGEMEQEIQLTLAEFCKDRRREVGLTLKDLADQMGYKHPNFVSMIESGQSRVPIEKFEVLSWPSMWPPPRC